jgi:hypothetical protein
MKDQPWQRSSELLWKLRNSFAKMVVWGGITLTAHYASAQFVLTPIPGLPNISSGPLAWGDYDNDGRLDFLISGLENGFGMPKLSLWRNSDSGFIDVSAEVVSNVPGVFDGSVAWGDFDNDGRLDFLVTGLTNLTSPFAISQVWRNTGSGFTNVPISGLPGVAESAVAWRDFDGDGRLDFLITGTTNGNLSGAITQLWRNTGNGFTNYPILGLTGAAFGSVTWGDFDNDGRPDFLITGSNLGSQLWRNTGTGFTNVPIPGLQGVFVSSAEWGDYDNDGLLDFLIEGLSTNGFIGQLWRNTGTGFTNVPVPGLPVIGDGSLAWADYDNDGRLDFLITGLSNGVTHASQLWRNTGTGFTNVPIPGLEGNFNNALAWGDFDNDGRLDFLIVGTTPGGPRSQLWQNIGPSSNSPPAAPAGLTAIVSGTSAVLRWDPPVDDHTPATGLSYAVRIGTTPGAGDILSPEADPVTGRRRVAALGSLGENLSATFLLPPGDYFWSVQAVDSGFVGSPFAAEQRFSISPLLIDSVRHRGGVFEFGFSATPGASFTAIATTNDLLPSSNWTELGPVPEESPGHFRFTDGDAANQPQRFYRIRSP